MSQIKNFDIKCMIDGDQKVESLGRGNGAFLFKKTVNTNSCYYRYWRGKQAVMVKIGVYRQTIKSPGKTLSELREQALEMVSLRKQVAPRDLKEYLQEQDREELRQQEAQQLKREQEARKGSLQDLMEQYANSLKERHRKRGTTQTYDVMTSFKAFIIKPFPDLARKYAGDIEPSDFSPVFQAIMKRNKPGSYNQLVRYLSACFNYGIKADYNPRESTKYGKIFNIKYNPVTPFPREPSTPRNRELSHEELRALWRDIELGILADHEQYGLFVQFCFACFGNRPTQLARLKWSDIDFEQRTFTLIDYKGKGQPRINIIPLTDRAMDIIMRLPETLGYPCLSGGYRDMIGADRPLFTTKKGTPLNYFVLENKLREHNTAIMMYRHRMAEMKSREYQHKERWTMKDFRRTATSIMTRARILKEHRYLLQSRTDGSIESRHYDVSDRLDEKREAAEKYDAMLSSILEAEGSEAATEKPVLDSYEGFRDMVMEAGELRPIKEYVREGYRKTEVQQWVRRMMSEGEVERFGRLYVLKGYSKDSEKRFLARHLKRKDYQSFRNQVQESGVLKSQREYVESGQSNVKIKRWFKLLKVEGIIERHGRGHRLKATTKAA